MDDTPTKTKEVAGGTDASKKYNIKDSGNDDNYPLNN